MPEAMAAGCVIVGSATPPVEEVIVDGENGLLVDFFAPKEIADRVDAVLDHPDRMAKMRAGARQTIIERYDLRRICLPRHLKLMQNLMAGATAARDAAQRSPQSGPSLSCNGTDSCSGNHILVHLVLSSTGSLMLTPRVVLTTDTTAPLH